MTYKQIEASREVRLWIGQVIVPALAVGAMAMSKPEIRDKVNAKVKEVKNKIGLKLVK
jgi:hypothetical protein